MQVMADLVEKHSFDVMVDALSNVQRRKLLVALLEHDPQDDSPVVTDDESEQDAVAQLVKMNHVPLPKLEEHGFIEWDRENDEVSKGPAFDGIRPLLELLVAHEDELPSDF